MFKNPQRTFEWIYTISRIITKIVIHFKKGNGFENCIGTNTCEEPNNNIGIEFDCMCYDIHVLNTTRGELKMIKEINDDRIMSFQFFIRFFIMHSCGRYRPDRSSKLQNLS